MDATPPPSEAGRRSPPESLLRLFHEFARTEAAGGIVLLVCTAAGLLWANSPWAGSYTALWDTKIGVTVGSFRLDHTLGHWINDALMALFFFVIGLEIKREFLAGELAHPRRAALPIAGAIGGMAVPAVIFLALNARDGTPRAWGVPVATDIAFCLGVLALMGPRVPLALKVFVTALAIADDIGAVLVIAAFYTETISLPAVLLALLLLGTCVALNRAGVRRSLPYAVLGIGVWLSLLESGLHPTLAGILMAATIPATRRLSAASFGAAIRAHADELDTASSEPSPALVDQRSQAVVQALETACHDAEAPLQRLLHQLHPWVSFGVLPLFALANAGVRLDAGLIEAVGRPVGLGILCGLAVGKPLGIALASWIAVRAGVAALPAGVNWRHILGAGCLAGIGFTMALFIAGLALPDAEALYAAKCAILTGSLVSALLGWLVLRRAGPTLPPEA